MMNITAGVKYLIGTGIAVAMLGFAPVASANTILPGTLEAHCEGGATPRIVLTWTDGVNANSNSIEKGDMYPSDPNNFWAFYGNIGMSDRTYTDTNVVLNQPYSYRIKYAPQVPSNVVTLTCTVAVNPPAPTSTPPVQVPAPTVTLTASPNAVMAGAPVVLSWNSENANSCAISPDGFMGTSGNVRVTPTDSTLYRATCTGAGGTAIALAYVAVTSGPVYPPVPPSSPGAPTVTLTASATVVPLGTNVTLAWTSQNAAGCIASDGWTGYKMLSGSEIVSPTTAGSFYRITCTSLSGARAESSAFVGTTSSGTPPGGGTTLSPWVTLSANPQVIAPGENATLSWTSQATSGCTASGGWSGYKMLSGSEIVSPRETTTYVITCSSGAGTVSDTRTVAVQGSGAYQPPYQLSYQQQVPSGQVLGVGDIVTGPENPVPWVLGLGLLGSLAFHILVVRRKTARAKESPALVRPIFIEPYGHEEQPVVRIADAPSALDTRLAALRASEGRPDTENIVA